MRDAVGDSDSINMDLDLDRRIKTEKDDLDSQNSRDSFNDDRRGKKHPASDDTSTDSADPTPNKVWKGLKYKNWSPGTMHPRTKYKKPSEREITEVGPTNSF